MQKNSFIYNLNQQASPKGFIGLELPANFLNSIIKILLLMGLLFAGCDKVTEVPVEMSISTSSITFPDTGGEQSFTITSNTNSWAVSSNASSWLTITPASGSKDGTVTLTAPANSDASERSATITVKGTGVEDKTITVKQPAIQNLSVSTTSLNFSASAEQKPFTITSNAAWTITSNQSWCTVQPVSGNGNREITVSVLANPELSSRNAILTVTAGALTQQITIDQVAASPSLSLSTSRMSVVASGEQQTFTVTSNTNWTVSSNSPVWLTVNPSSGSDNGTVTVTATANTTTSPRTAAISVSIPNQTSQTINITQAAANPNLSVSISTINFVAPGGQQTFTVTSNTTWTVSSNAPEWLTVSPPSGSNNGTVTVTATANTTTTPRTAFVKVSAPGEAAHLINVTQAGSTSSTPTLTLSTNSINFAAEAQQQTFTITSNTDWTVTSNAPSWLTVAPASGSNNGSISVSATANTAATQRTATITINGTGVTSQTINVTQVGTSPTISLSTTSMSFPSTGQQQSFTIISNTNWTVSSNSPTWLSVSPASGSNNGTITVTAAVNASASSRTATITISGIGVTAQVISITQAGALPSLTLSTTYLNFTSTGGQQSFSITSNTGWTVTGNAPAWLQVSPASGSNNSVIIVFTSENTGASSRTATVTVSGTSIAPQTISITQEANVSSTSSEFHDGIVAAASFGGGNGAQGNPYLISNARELKKLVDDSNNGIYYIVDANTYFKLTTDIHVTANEWIPIGGHSTYWFRGNFDGNGHIISGTLKSSKYDIFGFFGRLSGDYTEGKSIRISNLTIAATVKNETSLSPRFCGAIAGTTQNTTIINCHVTGMEIRNEPPCIVGGIVGLFAEDYNRNSIENCSVSTNISGGGIMGGIVGYNNSKGVVIMNCTVFATSSISNIDSSSGITNQVGGIAGLNDGIIINCTNQASISGSGSVGGITGVNNGTIHTNLNTGNIIGSPSGGLAGTNMEVYGVGHTYSCCTNQGTVNGQAANANNQIGIGKAVEPCPDGHTKR